MLQQLGDPAAVLHIRLSARHPGNLSRVGQHADERFLKHVDRFPEHARTLHRHVGDSLRLQPVAQGQHLCSHSPRGPGLRTHAVTVFLWTSNPHPRSITRSIAPSLCEAPALAGASCSRLCSAGSMAPLRGPGSSHVNFLADWAYHTFPTFSSARRGANDSPVS